MRSRSSRTAAFVALGLILSMGSVVILSSATVSAKDNDAAAEAKEIELSGEDRKIFLSDNCTGIYIGKDVAQDGKAIIARCADEANTTYEKNFTVIPAETGSNRSMKDTRKNRKGFSVEIPDVTYKYTSMMDVDENYNGKNHASCMNEYGLAVNGCVWTEVSDEWMQIDPLKAEGEGIGETLIIGLVACQAKTAREAIEVIGKYINQYGMTECNTILLSDKEEAWIFENYGGSTYAAIRLPDDKAAVFGNQVMIDWIDFDNPKDVIVSNNLKVNLDKLDSPVKDGDGRYNIARSVSGEKRYDFANLRTWRGHQLLAPSQTGEYNEQEFYSLLFSPDEKVSLFDVMELCGDRYQGTEYDVTNEEITSGVGYENRPDNEGSWFHALQGNRPIGTTKQSHVAVIQTWPELPDDCCHLQWLSMGNAEHCVFVPAFSGITDTFEKYKTKRTAPYDTIDDSYFFMCRRNAALAESEREYLSEGLKNYNMIQEKAMYDKIIASVSDIKKAYSSSKASGDEYVTKLSKDMAKEQYDNLSDVYDKLAYCHMFNLNDADEGKVTFSAQSVLGYTSENKSDKNNDIQQSNSGLTTGLIILSSALGAGLAGMIVYNVIIKKKHTD